MQQRQEEKLIRIDVQNILVYSLFAGVSIDVGKYVHTVSAMLYS